MDELQAAMALGVAEYTVVSVTHDGTNWLAHVRDMASHEVVKRVVPGAHPAPVAVEVDEPAEPTPAPKKSAPRKAKASAGDN